MVAARPESPYAGFSSKNIMSLSSSSSTVFFLVRILCRPRRYHQFYHVVATLRLLLKWKTLLKLCVFFSKMIKIKN